jgi:hypothetical protein
MTDFTKTFCRILVVGRIFADRSSVFSDTMQIHQHSESAGINSDHSRFWLEVCTIFAHGEEQTLLVTINGQALRNEAWIT